MAEARVRWDDWADTHDYFSALAVLSAGPLHPGGIQIASMIANLNGWPGRSVLDVGCGTGFIARALAEQGALVDGVEPNRFMRESCRRRGVNVIDGTCSHLPAGTWDAILFTGVLGFVPDAPQMLPEALNRLAPDGRVVIVDWIPGPSKPDAPEHNFVIAGTTHPDILAQVLRSHGMSCTVSRSRVATRRFSLDLGDAIKLATAFFPEAHSATVAQVVRNKLDWLRRLAEQPGPTDCYLLVGEREAHQA